MQLKFCGIRRAEDVSYVNAAPPEYVGFVFAKSPRQVSPAQAQTLSQGLSPGIRTVGVFVNAPIDELLATAHSCGLSVLQLHGDEDEAYLRTVRARWHGALWKAVRVRCAQDIARAQGLPVDALVLDAFSPAAYGGTGKTADFQLIAQNRPTLPFFLAGGLNADNVRQAIDTVQPDGVDLSGGLETDGWKDAQKIRKIYELVRGI